MISDQEEAADSACALHGAGKIHSPSKRTDMRNWRLEIRGRILRDWVPAVINGQGEVAVAYLCDAAAAGIISVIRGYAADGYADEAVFAVPN